MTPILHLHNTVAAVCPIIGVCIGEPDRRETWRIDFAPEATPAQQAAARAALMSFDINSLPPPPPTTEQVIAAMHGLVTKQAVELANLKAALGALAKEATKPS